MRMRYLPGTLVVSLLLTNAAAQAGEKAEVSGDQALSQLMKGNARYVKSRAQHPNQGAKRRTEVARGQHPPAIVVGCADSRVPPELIFDQGLGDLFVIRVAGEVVDDAALGSIEYAAEHLGSSLILVLGHERCGAVDAALKGGDLPGHIGTLAEAIKPAVEASKGLPGDALNNAVVTNARMVAEKLRGSEPILSRLRGEKKLKIVPVRYDLDTGLVTLIPESPKMAKAETTRIETPVPTSSGDKRETPTQ